MFCVTAGSAVQTWENPPWLRPGSVSCSRLHSVRMSPVSLLHLHHPLLRVESSEYTNTYSKELTDKSDTRGEDKNYEKQVCSVQHLEFIFTCNFWSNCYPVMISLSASLSLSLSLVRLAVQPASRQLSCPAPVRQERHTTHFWSMIHWGRRADTAVCS